VIGYVEPHFWAFTHDKLVCSVKLILKKNTLDVEKTIKFAEERIANIGIQYITVDYKFEGN